MDVQKQAETATWVQSVKDAAAFLNETLARMPQDTNLEVEVSAYERPVSEVAVKQAAGGRRTTLEDVRGLNADKCWQVAVDIKHVTTL
jgi:hypothetical protein